jgi:transcriptional regulator with XRE-family HTH domain
MQQEGTAQQDLITQLTSEISWYMHEHNISAAELATRMDVSPGRISQIFGGENLTLHALAAIAAALGVPFSIELQQEGNHNVE